MKRDKFDFDGYQIWRVYHFMRSIIENMTIYLLVWIFVLHEIQGCKKILTRKTRLSKIIGKIKVKSCFHGSQFKWLNLKLFDPSSIIQSISEDIANFSQEVKEWEDLQTQR